MAHVRRMHWVCISNIYSSSNTKNIDKELFGFKVEADPALLALAYAVSITEERHPAANDFEENELMVQHYNWDMCVLRQANQWNTFLKILKYDFFIDVILIKDNLLFIFILICMILFDKHKFFAL